MLTDDSRSSTPLGIALIPEPDYTNEKKVSRSGKPREFVLQFGTICSCPVLNVLVQVICIRYVSKVPDYSIMSSQYMQ